MCNWTIIMSGQGVVERASAELSKRINGLSLRVGKQHRNVGKSSSVMERMTNVFCGNNNGNPQIIGPIIPAASSGTEILRCKMVKTPPRSKRAAYFKNKPENFDELMMDEEFLNTFFWYFSSSERTVLAQVNPKWRDILYRNQKYWNGLLLCVNYNQLRQSSVNEKNKLYMSFVRRGLHVLGMIGARDEDIEEFVNYFPLARKHVHSVIMKWCGITDEGLQILMNHLKALYELELIGCNDLTENGLWTSLTPKLAYLKLADCINVSDEAVGAVAQLLPSLGEFYLQAYHVTDAALGFFSPRQGAHLHTLRLQSCWEITNHGIANIVHSLPNLTVLSLSGCTKITDGGVELISGRLKKLRSLDLSWCPRITDTSLEYIACDLTTLQQLTLDRCVNITEAGIGYLSTLPCLHALFLRWCTQIRDPGIDHIINMRNLQILSLAGCALITMGGLCRLTVLKHLRELELTNCPATTPELNQYLREQLPWCIIIE